MLAGSDDDDDGEVGRKNLVAANAAKKSWLINHRQLIFPPTFFGAARAFQWGEDRSGARSPSLPFLVDQQRRRRRRARGRRPQKGGMQSWSIRQVLCVADDDRGRGGGGGGVNECVPLTSFQRAASSPLLSFLSTERVVWEENMGGWVTEGARRSRLMRPT